VRAAALALLLVGCGAGTHSPVGAVRALAEAAQDGNRDEAWRLLGPVTRARLEADAARATQLAGARRTVAPESLLAVGWFAPRFAPAEVRELSRAGDRAVVEVTGPHGESERVDCVRVGDAWKVELP
jgi:hypothetical protein